MDGTVETEQLWQQRKTLYDYRNNNIIFGKANGIVKSLIQIARKRTS
ncbi:hypothetical protein [Ferroplasma sp.]|nr:hypothetical protein [Ferroplasma sp.]